MANGMQMGQNSLALQPSGQNQRRLQLAQSLMAQGMSGKPVQGGLVEALSRIGQAYFGNQIQQGVEEDQNKRRQEMAQTLQDAIQSTQPGATAQNPMVGPTQMSDAQRMAAILGQNPDTAPVGAQIQISQALKDKPEQYGPLVPLKGGQYLQWNNTTGKAQILGGSGQTINVGGDKPSPFEKEFGKEQAKSLIAQQKAAQSAVKSLQASNEAQKLLDEGMVTGAGANWIVDFGKALQQAGFDVGGKAIDNSQAFGGIMAQQVAQIIKQFGSGTGLSDKDREYAQQAAAGNINMSEDAIRRLISINNKASRNVITRFNERAKRIPRNVVPFDITVPMPEGGELPSAPQSGGSQSSSQESPNVVDYTDLK